MSENYSFRSAMNGFNRSDVIEYINTVFREKADLLSKIQMLESEIVELKSSNESLRVAVENAAMNQAETNKCEECDMAKIYEARLGAAMLDAKRFSEILVKEANDKAAALFDNAYASADATAKKVKTISQNILDVNKQFNDEFKTLLENMKQLSYSIDTFKSDVKKSGKHFDYTTEFVSEKLSGRVEDKSDINNIVGINFDDADDYDIRVDV